MAPTFFHYLPVPMDESWKEQSPRRCGLGLLVGVLVVLVVGLTIALAVLVVSYKSEACQNGLQLERECHNATQLLKKQLMQIKEGFLAAETRADACNQTVVSDRHSGRASCLRGLGAPQKSSTGPRGRGEAANLPPSPTIGGSGFSPPGFGVLQILSRALVWGRP